MLFIVGLVLIAAGALLVFRGRALLHWRRGYRDLSRFQRTWMVKGAAARRLRPDVALCDLHLPGISGLEVTSRIARGGWGTRVLVVSVLEDGPMPKRLLEAGADGYVGKNCEAAELVRAVRTVASGRRYLAGTIAQALALSGVDGAGTPFDALSARELEVAMLLLRGMRQEDIARRLSLSAKTVNTHKSRLFGKLGIRDSIALARMAGRHGLAEPL